VGSRTPCRTACRAQPEHPAEADGEGGEKGDVLSAAEIGMEAAGTAGAERTGSVQRRTGTVYGRAGGTIESGLGGRLRKRHGVVRWPWEA